MFKKYFLLVGSIVVLNFLGAFHLYAQEVPPSCHVCTMYQSQKLEINSEPYAVLGITTPEACEALKSALIKKIYDQKNIVISAETGHRLVQSPQESLVVDALSYELHTYFAAHPSGELPALEPSIEHRFIQAHIIHALFQEKLFQKPSSSLVSRMKSYLSGKKLFAVLAAIGALGGTAAYGFPQKSGGSNDELELLNLHQRNQGGDNSSALPDEQQLKIMKDEQEQKILVRQIRDLLDGKDFFETVTQGLGKKARGTKGTQIARLQAKADTELIADRANTDSDLCKLLNLYKENKYSVSQESSSQKEEKKLPQVLPQQQSQEEQTKNKSKSKKQKKNQEAKMLDRLNKKGFAAIETTGQELGVFCQNLKELDSFLDKNLNKEDAEFFKNHTAIEESLQSIEKFKNCVKDESKVITFSSLLQKIYDNGVYQSFKQQQKASFK